MDYFMNTMPIEKPRPILPPADLRNQIHRVLAANTEWVEVMVFARNFDSLSKNNGKALFAMFSRFIHELLDNAALRQRIIVVMEEKLSENFCFRDFARADKAWREVEGIAEEIDVSDVLGMTRLIMGLSSFFELLFGPTDISVSVFEYVKEKLRKEFFPEQGRLF